MRRRVLSLALAVALSSSSASAGDPAAVVVRAREQIERGAYADAMRTLSVLRQSELPRPVAIEAALLEVTAALVIQGPEAAEAACASAVIASAYDPEVARDHSPKVRAACLAAALKERP